MVLAPKKQSQFKANFKTEVRCQLSEVRGRRSDVRSRRSEEDGRLVPHPSFLVLSPSIILLRHVLIGRMEPKFLNFCCKNSLTAATDWLKFVVFSGMIRVFL
ncbi:MAG: hypothetical protein ACFFCW_34100, partial [Candidatus Hodarchaeota archaeon]